MEEVSNFEDEVVGYTPFDSEFGVCIGHGEKKLGNCTVCILAFMVGKWALCIEDTPGACRTVCIQKHSMTRHSIELAIS